MSTKKPRLRDWRALHEMALKMMDGDGKTFVYGRNADTGKTWKLPVPLPLTEEDRKQIHKLVGERDIHNAHRLLSLALDGMIGAGGPDSPEGLAAATRYGRSAERKVARTPAETRADRIYELSRKLFTDDRHEWADMAATLRAVYPDECNEITALRLREIYRKRKSL